MLIESISGIRGIFPTDLNSSLVKKYTIAFHHFCEDGPIIIGRDTRPSGAKLTSSITETLESVGRDIRDCDICPTPTVQFVVEDTDAVGGIVVTASHNPEEWNGLKFITKDGCFLNQKQFDQLIQLSKQGKLKYRGNTGTYSIFDQAIRRHIDRILRLNWIDFETIRNHHFKVAIDTVNGATSVALPHLLERLNCQVVKINCDLSGNFARGAEPLPQNLTTLCTAVKKHQCDIGFATDPDGDRLAVVDELGYPIGEEYTLVLTVDDFLRSTGSKQPIVTNLSTTLAVDRVAERYGANVKRSAVGEINVVELMKQVNSSMGGEGNGGVILRDIHLGRDSLIGATLILHRMSDTGLPLTTLKKNFPQYIMIKEKVPANGDDSDKIFRELAQAYSHVNRNTLDGLKLTWQNRWIHIRRSNTEPIFRIYAEADTEKKARELVNEVKKYF